jgi:hypothetical protein
MGQNRRATHKVAIPALSLLFISGFLIAGGQQSSPGRGVVEREFRVVTQGTETQGTDDPALEPTVSDANCTFLQAPQRYLETQEARNVERTRQIGAVVRWTITRDGSSTGITDPLTIRRNNFVDDEIFTRMASASIQSAPISGDEEFLRRVYLDLTGRIPSATDVTNFTADTNSNKRNAIIDTLIASPEFTDKWTMFLGDLLQNNVTATQFTRGIASRDAYYVYLKNAVSANMGYDQLARELITGTGDTSSVGAANWALGNTISMGPAQDTYDGAAVDLGNMFMGMSSVDCLLCHDGAHHLDQVNLWGSTQTRQNLWGLSAYFSQVAMTAGQLGGRTIADNSALAGYRLNTTFGNRTNRQPIGNISIVTPRYPFGTSANPGSGINTGETRRAAIARQVTGDIQFARAAVNYVWQELMVEAFVSPANGFDLARLDANNPPPAPWTLQPTNPQLLARLAQSFQDNRYDLRQLIRTIVQSSAYQLSSTYNGEWQPSYVPYYARHYVRRLKAEEILDAVTKATAMSQTYAFTGSTLPAVSWAGQMPDTREPTTNTGTAPTNTGNITSFLNAFGRGDRDVNPRRNDGTVLQALTAMNSSVVSTRMHFNNNGSRVRTLVQQYPNDPSSIIRQLYLSTLSRPATDAEVTALLPTFASLGNTTAAEDLQWTLLNRVQFLFNY